jgi:hypothetical protein
MPSLSNPASISAFCCCFSSSNSSSTSFHLLNPSSAYHSLSYLISKCPICSAVQLLRNPSFKSLSVKVGGGRAFFRWVEYISVPVKICCIPPVESQLVYALELTVPVFQLKSLFFHCLVIGRLMLGFD